MTQTLPNSPGHAIRALLDTMNAAWNRGDGVGYGGVFTIDADYINIEGTHSKGRGAIVAAHQRLFDSYFKGSTLEGELQQLRLLAPDIALVHRVGSVLRPGTPSPQAPTQIQTLVAVKQDGAWAFSALQNTAIRR